VLLFLCGGRVHINWLLLPCRLRPPPLLGGRLLLGGRCLCHVDVFFVVVVVFFDLVVVVLVVVVFCNFATGKRRGRGVSNTLMKKIMKKFLTLLSTVATHFIFQLMRSRVRSEVATKIFDAAFTEVFISNPIDVWGVRGASDVDLALVDEFL
jgi:hypothetical protein